MGPIDPSLLCRVTCRVLRGTARAITPRGAPVITSVITRQAVIALTVDDGPHPVTTPALLDVLRRHDARATFFLIGERAAAAPHLVEAIVAGGHEVGNHLWFDEPSVRLPPAVFRQQLSTVGDALRARSEVAYFRPGSGFFTPRMLRDAASLGHRCVLGSPWLVATTYRRDPEEQGRRLGGRAHPGAIVVLHEGVPERVRVTTVADALLRTLNERGLRAVSVRELMTASSDAEGRDRT